MAKICTQCNCKNENNYQFCTHCGSALNNVPSNSDKKSDNYSLQQQDPVARKVLSVILIGATLLCLLTTLQYIFGMCPIQEAYVENKNFSRPFSNIYEILSDNDAPPNNYVEIYNTWSYIEGIINIINSNQVPSSEVIIFYILIFLSQCCNIVIYFILTVLTMVSLLLIRRKSRKANILVIVVCAAGLLTVVLSYLIGHQVVISETGYSLDYFTNQYKYTIEDHILPQQTVLILLPLFALSIPLAIMLPKKEIKEE